MRQRNPIRSRRIQQNEIDSKSRSAPDWLQTDGRAKTTLDDQALPIFISKRTENGRLNGTISIAVGKMYGKTKVCVVYADDTPYNTAKVSGSHNQLQLFRFYLMNAIVCFSLFICRYVALVGTKSENESGPLHGFHVIHLPTECK